jgi:hypothetical protein
LEKLILPLLACRHTLVVEIDADSCHSSVRARFLDTPCLQIFRPKSRYVDRNRASFHAPIGVANTIPREGSIYNSDRVTVYL